jgi:hypothetical protein
LEFAGVELVGFDQGAVFIVPDDVKVALWING